MIKRHLCVLMCGSVLLGVASRATAQEPARRIDVEGRVMTWADAAEQPGGAGIASDFLVRRARVLVQAHITDRISASFQVGQDNIGARLLTPDSGVTIKDAYVSMRATNALQLLLGQFKVPFLRSNLESGFNQVLVDRGALPGVRPAREGSRDVGAMGWGNLSRFQYRVAVFDGSDQDAATQGGNLRLTSRVAYNFFTSETGLGYTGTSIGASRVVQVAAQVDLQNSRVDPRDDTAFRLLRRDYRAFALEAFLDQPIDRWAITGEGAWLQRDDDYTNDVAPSREIRGSYVQGAVVLPPFGGGRLQLAVRREDSNTDRSALTTESERTTAGGTWFMKGHSRKVQADYTVKRETPEISNDDFRLSLVLVF
jgi:hypothetical protein